MIQTLLEDLCHSFLQYYQDGVLVPRGPSGKVLYLCNDRFFLYTFFYSLVPHSERIIKRKILNLLSSLEEKPYAWRNEKLDTSTKPL